MSDYHDRVKEWEEKCRGGELVNWYGEPFFNIDMEKRVVWTDCGDSFYDIPIPFDAFIKIAKQLTTITKETTK